MGRLRENGQGLIEYALILLLVAIASIAALTAFGGSVTAAISSIVPSL